MLEFYSERLHIAKKKHICEFCENAILENESYVKEVGKYFGEFFSRCLHERCSALEHDYVSNVDSDFCWDDIYYHFEANICRQCCRYTEDSCSQDYNIFTCPFLKNQYSSPINSNDSSKRIFK